MDLCKRRMTRGGCTMDMGRVTYHCAICLIRQNPAKTLTGAALARVIERGRPTPPLPLLSQQCRYRGKVFTRRFKKENYLRYDWLAGCDVENKLFCWPCFVFCSDPTDTWGFKGFDGLSNFSNSVKTHSNQDSHILNIEKHNSYVPAEKRIVCEHHLPVQSFGQVSSSSFSVGQTTKPALSAVKHSAFIANDSERDDEDYQLIRHSDVAVEMVEGDEMMREPTEDDIGARDACDMSQSSSAGAEKYQLKWHSHQQNLNSSISCLYRNDRYADVMLITCNSEENFAIPAHKLVLGTSSAYFANIFDKNIAPPNAMTYIVLPPELTKRAIQTLIQYVYTGESTVSSDILNEVLRGGEILKIRGLWRNHASDGASSAPEPKDQPGGGECRQRTERISVDRVPLLEPRIAQNPVTIHDSPVILTNSAKSYGISQTAQMPASSCTPVKNVKKDVAIDPGERNQGRTDGQFEGHFSGVKRSHQQATGNQENNHQIPRQHNTPKRSPSRTVLSNAENVPAHLSGGATSTGMPEALHFLSVKEEPIEWTDINAEDIRLDKGETPVVKVELKEAASSGTTSAGAVSAEQNQEQVYSPLTCELCSETFTVPAEWVRHIESHTDPPHTVSKRRRRKDDDQEADITAALKCDLCAMYFVTPAEWVRHVQSTHTETELAMSNNSTLPRRRNSAAKPSSTVSSEAQAVAVSSATMAAGQQQQEKACSVCNKSFPSYASMIIHKRTHTGERPFYCDICNKGFNVKSNLLRHMRTLHNQQGSQSPTQTDPDSHGSD